MAFSMVCLGPEGQLPPEVLEDNKCFGAVGPKYGQLIKVQGPENSEVWMRRFFLLDVFNSAPFHPRNGNGKKLPKRFRVLNPTKLCLDIRTRESHFSSTIHKSTVKESGNLAIVSSGAFSEKQYRQGIKELRGLYGEDVKVTVVDARKEHHWLGDGEPFSQHTYTNHQNMKLSLEELMSQERDFALSHSDGVKVWARRVDLDLTPILREYKKVETEEQLVLSEKNVSYLRLPLTDHTALDLETAKRIHHLAKETVLSAQEDEAHVHVIWIHCLGGQGRASSLTLAVHVIVRHELNKISNQIPTASFEDLAKHIWYSGGKNLSEDPNPDKRYKYNGALCRRGCLQALVNAARESGKRSDLLERISMRIQEFSIGNSEIWKLQIDPSVFAEKV